MMVLDVTMQMQWFVWGVVALTFVSALGILSAVDPQSSPGFGHARPSRRPARRERRDPNAATLGIPAAVES